MAETNEEFDRIFREKLKNHEEKPSGLAWEKLENRLTGKKTSGFGIWWAIAATVTTVLVSGWILWSNQDQSQATDYLADEIHPSQTKNQSLETEPKKESTTDNLEKIAPLKLEEIAPLKKEVFQKTETGIRTESKTSPVETGNQTLLSNPIPEHPPVLIASAEGSTEELTKTGSPKETKTVESAPASAETIISNQAITEASLSKEDAPLYRIRIYSDGLKKGQEPDRNLITEMGKTVGKVEELLGKVDEGFAELQDKKSSLIAGLTSKK